MREHSKQPDNMLDYFTGGVPAAMVFNLDLLSLQEIMRRYEESPARRTRIRASIAELSFMALTCYFEAFCKNHFASILNICPNLVAAHGASSNKHRCGRFVAV